jgi:hypothetical protein
VKRMILNPEEVYQASHAAFDQGNFPRARLLASQCLAVTPRDSYWHASALGLKLWSANYLGDNATVEREAVKLLSNDAGADKQWFDALALFNLGLVGLRTRRVGEARAYFIQASQRYDAYTTNAGQPHPRAWTYKFFAAIATWASSGESRRLWQLARELANHPVFNTEMEHLRHAVYLYLRRAMGEDVSMEAETAARQGVSRAYLAYLLLERRQPTVH